MKDTHFEIRGYFYKPSSDVPSAQSMNLAFMEKDPTLFMFGLIVCTHQHLNITIKT